MATPSQGPRVRWFLATLGVGIVVFVALFLWADHRVSNAGKVRGLAIPALHRIVGDTYFDGTPYVQPQPGRACRSERYLVRRLRFDMVPAGELTGLFGNVPVVASDHGEWAMLAVRWSPDCYSLLGPRSI